MTSIIYIVYSDNDNEPLAAYSSKEDALRAVMEKGGPKLGYGYWESKLDPSFSKTWRVLMRFLDKKVYWQVENPTEEQIDTFSKNRVYQVNPYSYAGNHLCILTDAYTADEAKEKAKKLLLKYIEGEDDEPDRP